MISTVPMWVHVPVVLTLLFSQMLTVLWALRRIRDLQDVINMRDVLLGDDTSGEWARIHPGGTMVITMEHAPKRVRIKSRYQAHIQVKFDEA